MAQQNKTCPAETDQPMQCLISLCYALHRQTEDWADAQANQSLLGPQAIVLVLLCCGSNVTQSQSNSKSMTSVFFQCGAFRRAVMDEVNIPHRFGSSNIHGLVY